MERGERGARCVWREVCVERISLTKLPMAMSKLPMATCSEE